MTDARPSPQGPGPAPTDLRAVDAHLEVAAALIAEQGPADSGFRLRAAEAARAAGISRSTLYQLWPSMIDLAEDTRRYMATRRPDWRAALLSRPSAAPISTQIAEATLIDPAFLSVAMRSLASSTASGDLRSTVRSLDAEWFDTFGRWLDAHLHERGRQPVPPLSTTDLAVLLTALIEGTLIQAAMGAGRDRGFWPPEAATQLGEITERVLDQLTTARPAEDGHPPPPPEPTEPPDTPLSRRQLGAIEAILDVHVGLPFDHPQAPLVVRLIDPATLARRLGITQRRMYQIWPGASELNADLFAYQARRLRAFTETMTAQVLQERITHGDGVPPDTIAWGAHAAISAGLDADGRGLFAVAFAIADPHLSAVAEREFAAWRQSLQVVFLALMQVFDRRLAVGVEMAQCTRTLFAVIIGAMRLALLDPSLLDRTVGSGSETKPLLGLGWMAAFQGLTQEWGPRVPDAAATRV